MNEGPGDNKSAGPFSSTAFFAISRVNPEQIAHGDDRVTVCRNTIYTWIFRGLVPKVGHDQIKDYRGRNKRRKGSLAEANREMIKTRSIENRPEIINNRERLGDWELAAYSHHDPVKKSS